jgi:hypothetical protein
MLILGAVLDRSTRGPSHGKLPRDRQQPTGAKKQSPSPVLD